METRLKARFSDLYRKYFSGSFFVVFSLLSAAINYVYYPVLARTLSVNDFGASQALISLLSQASSIFAGLSLVTVYLVLTKKDAAPTFIAILQKIIILIIALLAVGVFILSPHIASLLHLSDITHVYLVMFDMVAMVPFIIIFGYLVGKKQFVAAASLQFLAVSLKLVIGGILTLQFGVAGAILGIGLGQILAIFIVWLASKRTKVVTWEYGLLKSFTPPTRKELSLIKPDAVALVSLLIVSSCLVIYASFDALVARNILGTSSGLYAAASTLATVILFGALPLINVLMPHITPGRVRSAHRMVLKIAGLILAICLGGIAAFALLPEFFLGIYGDAFTQISSILWRFAFYMSFVTFVTFTLQLLAFHRPRVSAVIAVIGVIALVIASQFILPTPLSILDTLTKVFVIMLIVLLTYLAWLYYHEPKIKQ